ncbi:uncharacterized protein BJX67DRAFT_13640 [Aspergillus lucknowensis]|uniref:Secreted protein n=1 Tax=Aspergillus lucknowensis TaxID=176173 RepID=A0ABR4M7S2_9EURO
MTATSALHGRFAVVWLKHAFFFFSQQAFSRRCGDSGFCTLAWVGFVVASRISAPMSRAGHSTDYGPVDGLFCLGA